MDIPWSCYHKHYSVQQIHLSFYVWAHSCNISQRGESGQFQLFVFLEQKFQTRRKMACIAKELYAITILLQYHFQKQDHVIRKKTKVLLVMVEMEPGKSLCFLGESTNVPLCRSCHAIGFPKCIYITRLCSKVLTIQFTMPGKRKQSHLKLSLPSNKLQVD